MSTETIKGAPTELERFVTLINEHPLLDNETIRWRQIAINRLKEVWEDPNCWSIIPCGFEQVVGILVGGCRWIANTQLPNQSDFDMLMFFASHEHAYDFFEKAMPRRDAIKRITGLHFLLSSDIDIAKLVENGQAAHFIVTPDCYIAGNPSIAQSVRLQIAQYIKQLPDVKRKKLWDDKKSPIQREFDTNYRFWGLKPPPIEKGHRKENENKFRQRNQRFMKQIDLRYHGNSHLIKAFMVSLKNFPFISSAVFCQAMEANDGKLTINPTYFAQGVGKRKQ